MKTADEIQQILKRDLRPRADKLLKVHKKETAELADRMSKLGDAIESKKKRAIQFATKALGVEVKQLAKRLSETTKLLKEINALEPAEDYGDALDEIEKLVGELGELERKLTKNFQLAKKTLDKGKDAIEADEAVVDGTELAGEWAAVLAELDELLSEEKRRLTLMEKVYAAARKAVNAQDAKNLKRTFQEATKLRDEIEPISKLAKRFGDRWKKWDPKKLPKDLQQEFERDQKRFHEILTEISGLQHETQRIAKEILSINLPEPDVDRLAKRFKVPRSHHRVFGKALAMSGKARLEALGSLIDELGLKTTVKEIIKTLEKLSGK